MHQPKLWILILVFVLHPALLTIGILVYPPHHAPFYATFLLLAAILSGHGLFVYLYLRNRRSILHKQHLIEWMAESIPGGVYIVDSSYRYSFVSINTPRFRDSFPAPETLIGRDYREHMRSLGVSLEQSDIIRALEQGISVYNVKLPHGPYVLSYDTVPLIYPRTGKIIGAATYWRDITEQEKDTSRLMELNSQYKTLSHQLKALVDTMPLSVLYIDQEAVITAVNDEFASFSPDFTKDQLIGMDIRELARLRGIPFESMHLHKALMGQTVEGELASIGEHTFLCYAFPIRSPDNGVILGVAALYQDISEIESLRTKLTHMESLSLIGQMAASITHEIRNPMSVVRGFIQLIHERNPGAFLDFYDIIRLELDRVNDIINDFLALAQNRVVELKESSLNDTVRSLEPMILADANLRGIMFRTELADGLPSILQNDKEIKQLLLNLSRNALDAMTPGGVLTIRTEASPTGVLLILSDTGHGIPKETMDKVLQPFYTTKENGTGLGLAVCSSIVKKHNGSIHIDSTEGVGTKFIIAFPNL